MPDPESVDFASSVGEQNRENPVRPDLQRANLREANLYRARLGGADLKDADLYRANLREANLYRTDLSRADLNGADLGGADLTGAHLIGAHLTEVDLKGANLRGANLSRAHLSRANLSGANFRKANLSGAHLSGADLRGADLGLADISGVNLSGAILSWANFSGARTSRTLWNGVDLRNVVGLQSINHRGPSSVGVDTLYLSEGRVSAGFLRGCGLDSYFVGMVPGLTTIAPIQHSSAFISYSHADATFAAGLYDYIFHTQKVPIWLDEHEIQPGDLIMREVDRAIRRTDRVILLCSEASLNSWWVEEEIERWTRKERQLRQSDERTSVVIPVDLDGYVHDCDHDYAATILKAKVLNAQGWDTDQETLAKVQQAIERALRRDGTSPFDFLARTATDPYQ